MKNEKGFTIIELIVVIALLAVLAGVFGINMIRTLNNNKDFEDENFINTIKAAADVYVMTYPDKISSLTEGNWVDIDIADISNAGFLNFDLKDPTTGETITEISDGARKKVRIKKGADGLLTIIYPVE